MVSPTKPYNPGLSEEAWKKLHRFLAKMHIKHGAKLAELEKQNALTREGKEIGKVG